MSENKLTDIDVKEYRGKYELVLDFENDQHYSIELNVFDERAVTVSKLLNLIHAVAND